MTKITKTECRNTRDTKKCLNLCIKILKQGMQNANLKDVWTKLYLTCNYASRRTKFVLKPILNEFGSQICASTIFEKPLITSTCFLKQKLDDIKAYDKKNPVFKNKRIMKKYHAPYLDDWVLWLNPKAEQIVPKDTCEATLDQIVIPLANQSTYCPKNEKERQTAIKKYQKHMKVDEINSNVSDEISISDILDNNQDRYGLLLGCSAIRQIDDLGLASLKSKHYGHVLNPDDLIGCYI